MKLINMYIDEKLLTRVDKWRFRNHIGSRAEAMRWLVEHALEQKPTHENVEKG